MDRQQVIAAMETDLSKSLKAFNSAAADMMTASYIIVMGKLSKLLQTVAGSRPLYDFMAETTQGYNFVEEFRGRQFRDEYSRPYIDMPEDPDEQIKFAFCMLFAIDTGKLNLENLLHTFYTDTDANAELDRFCNEVLRPFVENLNAVFIAPPQEEEQPEEDYADEYPQEEGEYAEETSAEE